jgi:hypothetical protein
MQTPPLTFDPCPLWGALLTVLFGAFSAATAPLSVVEARRLLVAKTEPRKI